MSFRLGPAHDPGALRRAFRRAGFVQVRDVLEPDDAARVHRCLVRDTTWNLVFADRGRHIDLDAAQLAALPKAKMDELRQAIYAQARDGFQYCYNNYPIHDARKAGLNEGHLLHAFAEWLNGESFLSFARAATGCEDIAFADAQATRFMPGHFLTTHDDAHATKNRRAAYIFNFTPTWEPDWGGYLLLQDEAGEVRRGLKPRFNTLNLLAVPQKHSVGIVAPFAGGPRLAITGWLRYGEEA